MCCAARGPEELGRSAASTTRDGRWPLGVRCRAKTCLSIPEGVRTDTGVGSRGALEASYQSAVLGPWPWTAGT